MQKVNTSPTGAVFPCSLRAIHQMGVAQGVHLSGIMVDESPLQMRYEPDSPWADEQGYVGYPDISLVIEQMNAMEASRAYEANITVAEATKSMYSIALEILT